MPKCKLCKVKLDFNGSTGDDYTHIPFIAAGHCFSCYHWTQVFDTKKMEQMVSVRTSDGEHYCFARNNPIKTNVTSNSSLGHGGRRFKIIFDDGTTVITNNLWAQGVMPEYWRKKFPSNATISHHYGK